MAMLEGMDDLPEVIVRTEEDKDVEKEAEPDATNPEQVIDNAKADEDGESEGEEEEEYEIEAIIQAKKGYFESVCLVYIFFRLSMSCYVLSNINLFKFSQCVGRNRLPRQMEELW